ncbi:MAG TPA: bifunctional UDP-N-acetylmuramoyl-tripeptide:D-alanyl-D-alanine ligase/alanine racemase [Bacteroidales bacterium]|nr:bifunctional UDP-N-acetylmuramoyl-tripeptide:D-alanyl-D-alanine ligase/alanine racemase [Bacteroidales bacterium]
MKLLSAEIADITGGALFGPGDIIVNEIITDSRQISFTEEVAFVAIRGHNHDGHRFLDNLYQRGIRVFIVENLPENHGRFEGAAFILSAGSVDALHRLAAWKRRLFTSPVIAITGSAGKTIVKEWLADLLGSMLPVIRSPKSYNSQIGVPLSVWKLEEKYRMGIFEAGISHPGEMEKLQKIIDPEIGVITNIGDAHRENFRDDEQKASEKLKLFTNAKAIIYGKDYRIIDELILKDPVLSSRVLVSWSVSNRNAAVFISKTVHDEGGTALTIEYKGNSFIFRVPFNDRASVENAVTAISVCLYLGFDAKLISGGLLKLLPVPMRMEIKAGINNCQLIEDYYNSDPGSLGMAIDYLLAQNGKSTTLILSDFVQAGRDVEDLYGEVATLVSRSGIKRFIGIGPLLSSMRGLFSAEDRFYFSTDDFLRSLISNDFNNEIILIKGSRIFEFEKIGRVLEQQVHQTQLEINLNAIAHNLNLFRSYLKPETRIMAMVKAFAYGAGSSEIASFLEYNRVSYLTVAYADEGVELRNAGVSLPVMVMNPDPSSIDLMIKYSLEPEIYSFSILESFAKVVIRNGLQGYPVHIKIDTGMHRLGFLPDELDRMLEFIRKNDCLRIVSVFSHLAGSDDESLDAFSRKQVEVFINATARIREATGYPFLKHILNSSGIIRMPQYQFDMVRPGIGIYGAGSFGAAAFKPAGRFITRISQVKKVNGGEPVGYGCADVSEKERVIAILPVGYADGLRRKMGEGRGFVFIKGRRVPLVGRVCMDMCMADITGTDAAEGDEAEIFGENISISEIAEICETIPYEILTSIPSRVKRVFFRE